MNLWCPVFHGPILCLVAQLRTVHARKQQIYVQNYMEKLPWMEKHLWTNTRIISIICHKWWTWCLLYLRAKITAKTVKYFSIHFWRVCLGWRQNTSWSRLWISLEFFFFFLKNFFSKIWVAKLGMRLISGILIKIKLLISRICAPWKWNKSGHDRLYCHWGDCYTEQKQHFMTQKPTLQNFNSIWTPGCKEN